MTNTAHTELEIIRVFDAPRELVFQAWTNAEHLAHWWGPIGMKLDVLSLDVRPQGMFHFRMTSPDGDMMWSKFIYQEILSPEKLVYEQSFSDEAGNTTRGPFSTTWPLRVLNTITLHESDGKTELVLRSSPIDATEEEINTYLAMIGSMEQGFGATFDQLEAYLTKH